MVWIALTCLVGVVCVVVAMASSTFLTFIPEFALLALFAFAWVTK